jgi:phosphate transport system permease protein
VVAGPLGIAAAIFCQYYAAQPVAIVFRRMIEVMAGIPSVVYGLWGLTVVVPLILTVKAPGLSLLAGIIVLALMILPTTMLICDAALSQVPRSYRLAASALGLSHWPIIWNVLLPAAKSGIWGALILGCSRAIGETMAVLMVCGNVVHPINSIFDPMRTLTANIALEMGYATGLHRSALFVSGLFLMAIVVVLAISGDALERKGAHE